MSANPTTSVCEASAASGCLREAKKRTGGSYDKAADPLDQRFFSKQKRPSAFGAGSLLFV
ncbi:hypothetical protein DT075_01020 [Bacillus licheniformis]|nr:hypothetical protein DT075_01020 [Bacillus licheniformis]